MKNNHYTMLSGADLVMMKFPEDRFCIQDIVPKGLVILSGETMEPVRSLAMDMSLRVVKGDKLWKMDTRQGAVLYMIHQHTLATARNLLMDMTGQVPDDMYVGVMTENSLEQALAGVKTFVRDHSDASMVMIELNTPVEQLEDALYASSDLVPYLLALKDTALEHGIAVVVILCPECFPSASCKTEDKDMVSITDRADGYIDMCIVDNEDRNAILRVSNPPMAPRLWSIACSDQLRRWVEEKAIDCP